MILGTCNDPILDGIEKYDFGIQFRKWVCEIMNRNIYIFSMKIS